MSQRRPRLRLTMSLRALLIVVLAIGATLGWVISRGRAQRRAVAEVDHYNGYVVYAHQFVNGKWVDDAPHPAPPWIRKWLGDEPFQRVARLAYIDQPISDATLAPLAEFPDVEELMFLRRMHHQLLPDEPPPDRKQVTEFGRSRLRSPPALKVLDIEIGENGEFPEGLLTCLQSSHDLQELRLDGTSFNDQAMPPLKGMSNLREFTAWGTSITGDCLAGLRGSPSMTEVTLAWSPTFTSGMAHVGTFPNLKRLNVMQTPVNDDGVAHLASLTHLEQLDLSRTQITDAGIVYLRGMTALERLELSECEVTSEGIAHLSPLKNLKTLDLMGTKTDDTGLEVIAGLHNLETLNLARTKVTDAGLNHLSSLPKLRELSLVMTAVSNEGIDRLMASMPNLKVR